MRTKQAMLDAIRNALCTKAQSGKRFRNRTANLGIPALNLDRALHVAGDLEDEELMGKMRAGK